MLTASPHGIERINENKYRIYIRDIKRRQYRLNKTHRAPGVFGLRSQDWWKDGQKPGRDAVRERCYRAERLVRPTIQQRTYATVREAATFFRNVIESDWFQRRFPHFFSLVIEYKPGSRNASACPTEHKAVVFNTDPNFMQFVMRGWIGFSTWAMGTNGEDGGEMIMLHELSHAIIPSGHHHDRRWIRTFVELVTHFMGKEIGGKLRASFKAQGLKMNPPRKVSPERRAAMAERLAAARLARKPLETGQAVAACLQ